MAGRLPRSADIASLALPKVSTGDINCRDCDVRSPEPNRQGFVKFKHLLRKAAARSAETICVIIGEILRTFTPTECANFLRTHGQGIML
jgi:hypothetical protein